MAIKLNQVALYGGSGGSKLPTTKPFTSYGSYLNQPTSHISVPKPVTLGGTTLPAPTPIGGQTVKLPSATSYAANLQLAGSMGGSKGGVTDEGVVTNPTPQIPQIKDSSSSPASTGNTYSNWITNLVQKESSSVSGAVSGIKNGINTIVQKAGDTTQKASGGVSFGNSEQPSETSAWAGTEPIDSYEEFLRNKETALGEMRDETTAFYDKQNQETLDYLEQKRQQVTDYATTTKETTDAAIQARKDAATGYANQQYQTLVDAINAQKESGLAMAEEQRQLLLSMSEEQRNVLYAAAEQQRVAAEQRADTERERGVVDARSSYEQNKATYGANAEAMGSMGLAGSGYSDYLSSRAYAQQRAETQAANAQADASKCEARYTEDQTRLSADAAHYQNKYNAEQAYSDRKYEIDTSYRTNMLNAEQNKNASIYEAESAERESKLQSDLTYGKNIFDTESSYNAGVHEANQTADAGKFDATLTYKQNILDNDTDIGAYRQEQEEKAEQEKLYAREAYTGLLEGANSGAYTADQLTQLAKDYGLSAEQTQSLVSAAEGYTKKQQAAANSEISSSTGDIVGTVQGAVDNGSISKEQGQTHVYNAFKDEIAYGNADTGAIDRAYQSGNISQEQYNDLKQRWNDNVETSSDFFYSNGTMLDKSTAKQALDNLTKSSWCSAATKNSLTAIYNSLYSPIQKDVSFNNDGSWWIFGSTDTGADGNNFSVIKDGTKYRVQYGGEVTDTNIKEAASGVGDGKCFGYQEKIYIKQNGKVYLVEERDKSYGDHYDSLYNIFFGSGDTTSVQSANNAGSAAKTGTGAWKSYSDASAAGYSNIMTQTEWARRKASTGCNTYQEYLDKMYAKYMM